MTVLRKLESLQTTRERDWDPDYNHTIRIVEGDHAFHIAAAGPQWHRRTVLNNMTVLERETIGDQVVCLTS